MAETVHGPDDRVQITNTAAYPWRVHASLLITRATTRRWIGTGWFIGPHTLITAGHCVYIKGSGVPGRDGWVKSIDVMPGPQRRHAPLRLRAQRQLPLGDVGWTHERRRALRLRRDHHPDRARQHGRLVRLRRLLRTPSSRRSTANISGYPGDKPSGTQWYDAHAIAAVDSRKVFYDIDTMGGQSGSAVYRIVDGKRVGVAVHAYGGATTNSGTRISTPVYNNLTPGRPDRAVAPRPIAGVRGRRARQPGRRGPGVLDRRAGPLPDIAAVTGEDGRFELTAPVPGRYTVAAATERAELSTAEVVVDAQGGVDDLVLHVP